MTITLAVLLGFALDWLLGDPKKNCRIRYVRWENSSQGPKKFCAASFLQRLRH